ncbi:MAG: hypothetical protein WA888_02850, partial [Burkholderiaceae bacterium]
QAAQLISTAMISSRVRAPAGICVICFCPVITVGAIQPGNLRSSRSPLSAGSHPIRSSAQWLD